MRREPRWVPRHAVESFHQAQLEQHGGLPGLRTEAGLEAALGRPRNKWGYSAKADLAVLTAAYGFGIATSHPFNDGNKRTAFLTMAAFLYMNGYEFKASEADVLTAVLSLAAGTLSEAKLTTWVRKNMARIPRGSS